MNSEIIVDINEVFLVMKQEKNREYSFLNMITKNNIYGLLKLKYFEVNDQLHYYYNITHKQNLIKYYEINEITKKNIANLFMKIIEVIQNGYHYLLNPDDIILEPEYLYVDELGTKVFLCYCTGYQLDFRTQIVRVIEYFMDKINHKNKDLVYLVYGLYQICREDEFTLDAMLCFLNENEEEEVDMLPENTFDFEPPYKATEPVSEDCKMEEVKVYSVKTKMMIGVSVAAVILVFIALFQTSLFYHPVSQSLDFEKIILAGVILFAVEGYFLAKFMAKENMITVIAESEHKGMEDHISIEDDFETVLLSDHMALSSQNYKLIPLENTNLKEIVVEEFPFFIGKLKTKMNFTINQDFISRYHAKIDKEKVDFFLTDLKSKNGTFVNHHRLEPNKKCKIKENDVISFANFEFRFVMENSYD